MEKEIKYRLVKETELLELIVQNLKLLALESGGVDNWDYYGDSLFGFVNKEKTLLDDEDFGFEDIARKDIESYTPLTITYNTEEDSNGKN